MVALLALAPAASAQYGPPASLTLAAPSVAPGGSDTIIMTGCAPGAEATFSVQGGAVLGTATADSEGVAEIMFTVPADTAPGVYTLVGQCLAPDGSLLTLTTTLTVTGGTTPTTAPSGGGGTGTLPRTGSDNAGLVRAGVVLVAVGGIAALIARKRSQVKA